MKKTALVVVLLMGIQVSYAQTWSEWFRQRRTQIRYLLEQIAALKVYTDHLQTGYRIARDGTNVIRDIKQGDFTIHNGYFTSLKTVSPAVKGYSKVPEIIAKQLQIIQLFKKLLDATEQSTVLIPEEKAYIRSVYAHLNGESEKEIEQLFRALISGELETTEAGRLAHIDRLHSSTSDRLSFCYAFISETVLLIRQRSDEGSEVNRLRKLYGIK